MMTTTGMRRGLLPISVALLALAGCSGEEPPSSQSEAPTATDATEPQEELPSIAVLEAPTGYERSGVLVDLGTEWTDVLVAEGGCTLSARGASTDDVADDVRAASFDEVAAMAEADGAPDPGTAERELVTSGAGEGNDPAHTLMVASGDWTTGEESVRGLARVANVQHYDGSRSSQVLALRFGCPGEAIEESEWEAAASVIRPMMTGHVGPGGPWSDGTSD
ncbi:hypothetical protein LQF12_06670 [Ruania suaedae]|uniref:hypothetical protein n=1 Tax=Ruania suaedae TaxID=2897774 RepID=UPI001E57B770|nr:hypothetical protein [Ruania suaedae]UFU04259.1 hypothetical protein LQF12_06670 [Ruania suaedae]